MRSNQVPATWCPATERDPPPAVAANRRPSGGADCAFGVLPVRAVGPQDGPQLARAATQ